MKKIVSISILLFVLLGGYTLYQYLIFTDGKVRVVFCDVGQGDAILITSPKGKQVLIDGGPSRRVLDCLSGHMPFWDRTLELVILSHPHLDHYEGLISVLERYEVKSFATEKLKNQSESFQTFESMLSQKHIPIRYITTGDQFVIPGKVTFRTLGPEASFLAETSNNGFIRESGEFASLISLVSYGSFRVLLTGDSQLNQLERATQDISSLSVLQAPHHGSKTGLDVSLVKRLSPESAVISVGKNSYGHPSAQTLKILSDEDIKIFRTDEYGSIVITSDGETWQVKYD